MPVISGDGLISSNANVPRYFRYMAMRYCDIESFKSGMTNMRITPSSLEFAKKNGLDVGAFLSLIKRFSKNKIPPALEKMLSSSDSFSLPATIYSATILTIPNDKVLEELLNSSRLEKWIMQQINSTSILIDSKGINDIRRFLMEREIFVDIQI